MEASRGHVTSGPQPGASLDTVALRRVFGAAPSPVAAIAAIVGGQPVGLAVSSFVPVSLKPALASACFAQTSQTWTVLRQASRIGISILAQEQHYLGRQLAAAADQRFDGVTYSTSEFGAIRIEGSAAYFECSLEKEMPAGDHAIGLFRIIHGDHTSSDPLVFCRSQFRALAG